MCRRIRPVLPDAETWRGERATRFAGCSAATAAAAQGCAVEANTPVFDSEKVARHCRDPYCQICTREPRQDARCRATNRPDYLSRICHEQQHPTPDGRRPFADARRLCEEGQGRTACPAG